MANNYSDKPTTTREDIVTAGGFISEPAWGSKGDKIWHVDFESVSNMAEFDYVNRRGDHDPWSYGSVDGFTTYAECQAALREGRASQDAVDLYNAMRESLEPAVSELIATMPSARRKRKFDIEGDEVNIERVMMQNPEHWEKRIRGQHKKTVRIAINYGYSAGTDEQEIMRGAARGIALADVLMRLGHGVEIQAVSFSKKYTGQRVAITAMAKPSDKPVDPQMLLVLAMPALSRIFEFGVLDVFGENYVEMMRVDRVTQEYVDLFDIDVFATGDDFRFMGPDTESHIAQAVAKVNAMTVAPATQAEVDAVGAIFDRTNAAEA
jgi:hypothetical protein